MNAIFGGNDPLSLPELFKPSRTAKNLQSSKTYLLERPCCGLAARVPAVRSTLRPTLFVLVDHYGGCGGFGHCAARVASDGLSPFHLVLVLRAIQ